MATPTAEEQLFERLDAHPGGPIELSQDECRIIASLMGAIMERNDLLTKRIQDGLALLLPQTHSVSPSLLHLRKAVSILQGRG